MKTATLKLRDKEYTVCFSAYVIAKCEEKEGSFEKVINDVNEGKFSTSLWLLAQMLKAGELYEKINGQKPERAPTYDELLVTTGYDDFTGEVFKVINEAIDGGTAREVEVETKNAETTQEE